MTFEKVSKYLEDNDYRCVGVDGANKSIYISEGNKVTVTIERNMDTLTKEDEELIRNRLLELGYL